MRKIKDVLRLKFQLHLSDCQHRCKRGTNFTGLKVPTPPHLPGGGKRKLYSQTLKHPAI